MLTQLGALASEIKFLIDLLKRRSTVEQCLEYNVGCGTKVMLNRISEVISLSIMHAAAGRRRGGPSEFRNDCSFVAAVASPLSIWFDISGLVPIH